MKMLMKVNSNVHTRLRIREGPSLSAKIVGYLYPGDEIISTEMRNGWYNNGEGWCDGVYLKAVKNLDDSVSIETPPQPPPDMDPPPINNYVPPDNPYTTPIVPLKTVDDSPNVNFKDTEMSLLFRSLGLNFMVEVDKYNTFKRFNHIDPSDKALNTKEYIFFTKPDLNIYEDAAGTKLNPDLANISYFRDLHYRLPKVLRHLQRSVDEVYGGRFMNHLSWRVKNNLDLPGILSKEYETSSNQYGTRMYYKKHSFESDENFDFSLEFSDSKKLELYHMFKAWDMYCNLKAEGRVKPKDKYRNNMELHDQISIYKFIVAENGMDIIYFAKIIGVFPKGVPRDAFSNISDGITYNIPFKGIWVEDMDPLELVEFNYLARPGKELPLYDKKRGMVNGKLPRIAYVKLHEVAKGKFVYRLHWRE